MTAVGMIWLNDRIMNIEWLEITRSNFKQNNAKEYQCCRVKH